jgi:hypothetical protein
MSDFSPLPIESLFAEALRDALHQKVGLAPNEDVETYLLNLLVDFLRQDRLYSIRDENGAQVKSVSEMLDYGDVTSKAMSFNQEREVHRHIGDFLLFWSGMFPEALPRLTAANPRDAFLDCTRQGRDSYFVVSTFEHVPFAVESPLFRRLSEDFEAYQSGFNLLRSSFRGLSA